MKDVSYSYEIVKVTHLCFIYSLTRVYSFKTILFTMFYSFDLKTAYVYDWLICLDAKYKFSLRLSNSKYYFYTIIYMWGIPIVSIKLC